MNSRCCSAAGLARKTASRASGNSPMSSTQATTPVPRRYETGGTVLVGAPATGTTAGSRVLAGADTFAHTSRPRRDSCAPTRHGWDGGGASPLTCDHLVTYLCPVTDDDRVFKALADPTRRYLLDLLFAREGQTLTELESAVEMTRYGVMKHLKVLEEAGLVVTRRSGREKLHFLNAVPIREVHDRWIDKYTERHVAALLDLKSELESER